MYAVFLHILAAALWLGTAVTLPFWGNRMKRADHLHTVLGIMDTVFVLKVVFVMGGLVLTGITGMVLMERAGLPYLSLDPGLSWLTLSQLTYVVILLNSCLILYLMAMGRRGRRSYFRYVPPLGYNNIALILLVYLQMTVKPAWATQPWLFFLPLVLLIGIDLLYVRARIRHWRTIRRMPAEAFAELYFGLLREEDMTELLRLFHDDAEFHDPFATGPVIGIKAIERFFQSLGEQFEHIEIIPRQVSGDTETITTRWEAVGTTKNGVPMPSLLGTNTMKRIKGRIKSVHIDFDLADLPQVMRVSV